MTKRFLLHVDLLGFSDLIKTKKRVIPALFRVLERSNAHNHGDFRVIQFSDTLLVYSQPKVNSKEAKQCLVMYLCEFFQEIQYMLLGRDTYLRGLITYGHFEDTGPTPNAAYKHIRGFWGEALIKAYQMEKSIQAIGLFVDRTVHSFMDIFETHKFDKQQQIWFADTATMLRGKCFDGTDFSYAELDIRASGTAPLLAYDFFYLKRLFQHGHDLKLNPRIRNKYLTTWEIYRQKYQGLCSVLENSHFKFERVVRLKWAPLLRRIGTPRGFFG